MKQIITYSVKLQHVVPVDLPICAPKGVGLKHESAPRCPALEQCTLGRHLHWFMTPKPIVTFRHGLFCKPQQELFPTSCVELKPGIQLSYGQNFEREQKIVDRQKIGICDGMKEVGSV